MFVLAWTSFLCSFCSVSGACVICFWLSVPVQLIAWKDSVSEVTYYVWSGTKTLPLTNWPTYGHKYRCYFQL